ncbi:MAG: hypothetical protein HY600_00215 [Candidatus Omnitrophica bacterium]|nr:hypothetical protein [Candidatus Omnitrophota bacterium]
MRTLIIAFGMMAVLGRAVPASATLDNTKSFKQAYPGAKTTGCKTCHQGAIGKKGDLNAYGLALQQAKAKTPADAKKLTPAEIKAVEAQDADGDGISNAAEVAAGTNPGDPASK